MTKWFRCPILCFNWFYLHQRGNIVILMSVEEFAEYLGENKRTIYRYIQSGDCPRYIRLTAKNIKFDKADVDAWLDSKKIEPRKEKTK